MTEMIAATVVNGFIIIIFLILAIYLYQGKGGFLIAGYNTLPEEEKEKYDEPAICKFLGKNMFILCGLMVLWTIAQVIETEWLFVVSLILFMGDIIFMMVYLNTGNRFRKDKENNKSNKKDIKDDKNKPSE